MVIINNELLAKTIPRVCVFVYRVSFRELLDQAHSGFISTWEKWNESQQGPETDSNLLIRFDGAVIVYETHKKPSSAAIPQVKSNDMQTMLRFDNANKVTAIHETSLLRVCFFPFCCWLFSVFFCLVLLFLHFLHFLVANIDKNHRTNWKNHIHENCRWKYGKKNWMVKVMSSYVYVCCSTLST